MIEQHKLDNIRKLEPDDVKAILYTCIDALGVHDVPICQKYFGVNRSRIYQLMTPENTLVLDSHKFLMTKYI